MKPEQVVIPPKNSKEHLKKGKKNLTEKEKKS